MFSKQWMPISGRVLLCAALGLGLQPVSASEFHSDFSTSQWTGGSLDNDGDGIPDYCMSVPDRSGNEALLIIKTEIGFILGLTNTLWDMTGQTDPFEITLVIDTVPYGPFPTQVTGKSTLAVIVRDDYRFLEALSAGNLIEAYPFIGNFEFSLAGSRDVIDQMSRCFEQEVRPYLSGDMSEPGEPAPYRGDVSYSTGKAAYDREEYGTALAIWQEAAVNGDAEAMNGLGILYKYGRGVPQDYEQARYWYLQGAEKGLDRAQYNLGRLYDKGLGTQKDAVEALYWYEKSAAQGYDRAQLAMGIAAKSGKGMAEDLVAARRWYLLAAQNGNRAGQNNLASMMRSGTGGPKDLAGAVEWYRRSAQQGFHWGQLRYGEMLMLGEGVDSADPLEGYKWLLLAAMNDNEKAPGLIAEFTPRISDDQKATAIEAARGWQPVAEPRGHTPAGNQAAAPAGPKPLPDDIFSD